MKEGPLTLQNLAPALLKPSFDLSGASNDDAIWRLSVCLSRTLGLSQEQSPKKTKIGTKVAHVTRDSDTTFKVKGQSQQAALVGCSSRYIIYKDDTIFYATAQSEPQPVDLVVGA